MKIKRYLREEKLTKQGFAPILVSISWAGNRLRVASGEVCRPEHWDAEYQKVKPVKGSYYNQINPKLNSITETAEAELFAAGQRHELLTPAVLTAALAPVLNPQLVAPAVAAALAVALGPPAGLFEEDQGLFAEWMAEQAAKANRNTGQATSKNTIKAYNSTRQRLLAFEQHRGGPLQLANMSLVDFYAPFREYVVEHLGRELNTFGKYIAHLNTFLTWCDTDRELPVHRQYRKFTAPSRYVGVDTLTEEELVSIAGLDFGSTRLRERIFALYPDKQNLGIEGKPFVDYYHEVELARDKFLQCCYTGLSIQDADAVGPDDVRNGIIYWERGKWGNACHIPYYDDALFKPVALTAKYAGRSAQLVPACPLVNRHLKLIARLVKLTRIELTTKIGRKTFVTLKLFQGVPQRIVMMATGHTTEASFNHYVGVDVLKLLEQYKRYAPAA